MRVADTSRPWVVGRVGDLTGSDWWARAVEDNLVCDLGSADDSTPDRVGHTFAAMYQPDVGVGPVAALERRGHPGTSRSAVRRGLPQPGDVPLSSGEHCVLFAVLVESAALGTIATAAKRWDPHPGMPLFDLAAALRVAQDEVT